MPKIEGEVIKTRRIEGEPILPIGLTPDIQVGTIETLDNGTDAYVALDVNSTRLKPVFNFGIPKGLDGKDGQNGKDGIDGIDGAPGKDGVDGAPGKDGVDGKDYVITESDYNVISEIVKNDIQPILEEAKANSETAISISKGANQALSYLTYPDMITNFNAFDKNKFEKSQSVMIKQLNVPDMWVYDLSDDYVEYTYTTDEAIINALMSDAGLHVGYYILGPLETQKVDLTDYVKNTDYATYTKAGVVRPTNGLTLVGTKQDAIGIVRATNTQINDKTELYAPIVPVNLDYAIKAGLSNNQEEWTEEEKTAARELLGVVLAKTGTPGLLTGSNTYALGVNASGGLSCLALSYADYKAKTSGAFISKGTLENVLNGRSVTLTQADYDELLAAGNIDEEIEYNIVEG